MFFVQSKTIKFFSLKTSQLPPKKPFQPKKLRSFGRLGLEAQSFLEALASPLVGAASRGAAQFPEPTGSTGGHQGRKRRKRSIRSNGGGAEGKCHTGVPWLDGWIICMVGWWWMDGCLVMDDDDDDDDDDGWWCLMMGDDDDDDDIIKCWNTGACRWGWELNFVCVFQMSLVGWKNP